MVSSPIRALPRVDAVRGPLPAVRPLPHRWEIEGRGSSGSFLGGTAGWGWSPGRFGVVSFLQPAPTGPEWLRSFRLLPPAPQPMAETASRDWSSLTSREVELVAARDPGAVLTLAAVEQHGPHLPLGTDLEIARGILAVALQRLPREFPVVVLPTQAVGTSAEHGSFPGTLSLAPRLLEGIVQELGAAIAGVGIRRLVLFNSHGGNRATLDTAALRLRKEHGLLVVKATYTRFPRPPGMDLPEAEWRHGFHGGAVETAMMLHLRPDLVDAEAFDAFPSTGEAMEGILGPEGAASFAWLAEDLHPSGAVGDPRRASAAMGDLLVSHYGRALARILEECRSFSVERLG